MLTILWDWPSPDIACIIWCLGAECTYPSTSISPQSGVHRNTNMLTTMPMSCLKDCGRPSKRLKCRQCQRQRDGSGTTVGKIMPFHWSQVTWSWLKPMPTGGEERWRIAGRRKCTKRSAKLWKASLPTSWKTSSSDAHKPSTEIDFSHCSDRGDSSLYSCAGQAGQVTHHHPRGTNSEEWDWGSTTKCELSITSPASDRWDSSRVGEQETPCVHLNVSQSYLDWKRLKHLM